MMFGVAEADVAATRRPTHDGQFATEFVGSTSKGHHGPLAYLVEIPEGGVIKPHFHEANQFQLVVRGEGRIGKRRLAPGDLLYADAFTPYGPIVGGPAGLAFLTLRQMGHVGTHYMPGSKREQRQRTGRNLAATIDLVASGETSVEAFHTEEDGVTVHRLEAAAGESMPLPGVDHGGAYVIVLRGSVVLDGREYPALSCLYQDPEPAADDQLAAGAAGAVVAYLSYPRLDSDRGLPARQALASEAGLSPIGDDR
jgi:hypothetical protein